MTVRGSLRVGFVDSTNYLVTDAVVQLALRGREFDCAPKVPPRRQLDRVLWAPEKDTVRQTLEALDGLVHLSNLPQVGNITFKHLPVAVRMDSEKLQKSREVAEPVLDRCSGDSPATHGVQSADAFGHLGVAVADDMCCGCQRPLLARVIGENQPSSSTRRLQRVLNKVDVRPPS